MTEIAAALDAAGIRTLSVPTPFGVGDVNAYLLEGSPLTLIDNGPNQATALRVLDESLARLGRRVDELELLLITHPHPDHAGLTQALADGSGAEVGFLAGGSETAENYPSEARLDDEHAAELMLRHGVEPHVVQALRTMAGLARGFGAASPVTRRLDDGEEIEAGGRRLAVLARPGHSPWDTLFLDGRHGVLFTGDHLLPEISSNGLVTRPGPNAPPGAERSRPLLDYRRSLEATRELDVDILLAGHGPAATGHRALVDLRLREMDERAEHLYQLLEDGPRSAHELALSIWGDVAIEQAFLTISEVLGHIDLLVADGLVVELPGETLRFERST